MNSLRIRVVKLRPDHGVGNDFIFGVQISTDGLVWWTVNRFKVLDQALEAGRILKSFVGANLVIKEESILWETKL
jgi:hypothetical protein